jgi:GntR family transcriptional repressor for pyruvate dehydrogenase complex
MTQPIRVAAGDDALGAPRVRRPRRQKIAMAVAQQIVEEIVQKRSPPGTKLPSEREMLAQYEVGRGTLRESLRYLEMNGVLVIRPGPGGGPVVAEPNAYDLASTLGLFLELNGTSFGSILQVRELLEPVIAKLAAMSAGKDTVDRIGDTVTNMEANLHDLNRFLAENEQFHRLVAVGSANPMFALLVGSLDHIIDGSRIGISFPLTRRQAVLKAHRAIHAAIASGDADGAEDSMRRHVLAFRRYTLEMYPGAVDRTLRWSDVAP